MTVRYAFVLVAILTGCGLADALAPGQSSRSEIAGRGLRVTLTVSPGTLDPPGTVVATLTYQNLTADTVTFSSGVGCLSFASVYREGTRISFPSTDYYCTSAVTYRQLEPHGSLTATWPLTFERADSVSTPSGRYRFVAQLNTHAEDLEQHFTVR